MGFWYYVLGAFLATLPCCALVIYGSIRFGREYVDWVTRHVDK